MCANIHVIRDAISRRLIDVVNSHEGERPYTHERSDQARSLTHNSRIPGAASSPRTNIPNTRVMHHLGGSRFSSAIHGHLNKPLEFSRTHCSMSSIASGYPVFIQPGIAVIIGIMRAESLRTVTGAFAYSHSSSKSITMFKSTMVFIQKLRGYCEPFAAFLVAPSSPSPRTDHLSLSSLILFSQPHNIAFSYCTIHSIVRLTQ
jgi:hypothetical protein